MDETWHQRKRAEFENQELFKTLFHPSALKSIENSVTQIKNWHQSAQEQIAIEKRYNDENLSDKDLLDQFKTHLKKLQKTTNYILQYIEKANEFNL
jgi:hypothetical protein